MMIMMMMVLAVVVSVEVLALLKIPCTSEFKVSFDKMVLFTFWSQKYSQSSLNCHSCKQTALFIFYLFIYNFFGNPLQSLYLHIPQAAFPYFDLNIFIGTIYTFVLFLHLCPSQRIAFS